MDYVIEGGYAIFPDGSRVRAISGGQDLPTVDFQTDPNALVDAFNVDFVLNVGGPVVDTGGVPFGDPAAAGYVGLSDYIRGGGNPELYTGTVATNSSLSDILRTTGGDVSRESAFDPSVFNPNAPGTPSDWSITSVIDSVTKGIVGLGGTAIGLLNATRSPSSGQRAPSGGSPGQTLGQRIFGMNPGAGGNLPQMLVWAAFAAVGGLLIFTLGRRTT